ncbi:divergent PAP2 family protein [Candidatus Woesearchaeota archaeon]|nr:divergent PAP2 family protein [Candidatus Woesearchaeota archaeon]
MAVVCENLVRIITHPIVLAAFFAWFGAQLIKVIIFAAEKRRFDARLLYATGGMPSGHAASVSALTVAIYLYEGVSTAFVLSGVFALVVIRDALYFRSLSQADYLLADETTPKKALAAMRVKPRHTLAQVLVGILFGTIIALVVFLVR